VQVANERLELSNHTQHVSVRYWPSNLQRSAWAPNLAVLSMCFGKRIDGLSPRAKPTHQRERLGVRHSRQYLAPAIVAACRLDAADTRLLLSPTSGQLAGATDVVRAHFGQRAPTWHAYGLGVLLSELAEPDILTRGSAELLRMASPPAEPTIAYTGEAETWLPRL
jgi:hypothetical protein